MSGAGNDHPAHAWAGQQATLDWLQLLLDDPLATDVTATGVLPAGRLCDVYVVEVVALASNLTAHFNIEQAPARYALHVPSLRKMPASSASGR